MRNKERPTFSGEFKREAVDLGVGLSTLTRWLRIYRDQELLSGPYDDVDRELARLRKENELLRAERDLLKRRHLLRKRDKSMKFRYACAICTVERHIWLSTHTCRVG